MTGQELYEAALDVAGMRLRNGGIPATASDLTARCVSLINTLIAENIRLNAVIEPEMPTPLPIQTLEDTIILSDRLLVGALPFGLAALLLMSEDTEQSVLFSNRYTLAISKIKAEIPAVRHEITEVYN